MSFRIAACVCLGLLMVSTGCGSPLRGSAGGGAPAEPVGRVELLRDHWGVPHVFADTDAGAMYGLGWAQAEDRPFQMHYALRIIQGRSAEVLGNRPMARGKETTVDHDRKMRTFGFYRAAVALVPNLDRPTVDLLQAYCDGVNASFEANRATLPPLFAQTGLTPEPWTPADCIASWWHLGQFFATDGTRELLQFHNQQDAKAGIARGGPRPQPAWLDDDAAVVRREDVTDAWLGDVYAFADEKGIRPTTRPSTGEAGPKFSHAWVVGGVRTTTGSAVLVSDPQTPVRFPALWHEFHIKGATFDCRGVGIPGSPALLIGWNRNVAWGATALGADQADLFRLKVDPSDADRYEFDGRWRQMEKRVETIRVKNADPINVTIRTSHLGPIVNAFAFARPDDPPVALHRVPICQTDRETITANFGMMRATDASSLDRAAGGWQFPSLHLVFGDKAGHIGYRLCAAIPLRAPTDVEQGNAAVECSRSEQDWRGYIPPAHLPHLADPSRGWIASANHRPVASFYPLPLGVGTGGMGHTVRSWRLYELLAGAQKMSPDDVLDVHYDMTNAARRSIVRAALRLHETQKDRVSKDAVAALGVLKCWYRVCGARSDQNDPAGLLAGEISTFFRFVNTPLAFEWGGGESGICRWLRAVDKRLDDAQNADAPPRFSADEQAFLDAALAGAWKSAVQKYGDDPKKWPDRAEEAAKRDRLSYFDTLDGFGSLDRTQDQPIPLLDCIDGGTLRSQRAQSYTQFVPLHDVDQAMSLLPPGNTETPRHPTHRATDQLWGSGQLHPAPLSRGEVEKIARGRRVLR